MALATPSPPPRTPPPRFLYFYLYKNKDKKRGGNGLSYPCRAPSPPLAGGGGNGLNYPFRPPPPRLRGGGGWVKLPPLGLARPFCPLFPLLGGEGVGGSLFFFFLNK